MSNERWKCIRRARPDRASLDFLGDEVATIPLSSFVFRLSSIIEATPFPNYFPPPTSYRLLKNETNFIYR